MKHDEALAAYITTIGQEIQRLLCAKGASNEDAEDIVQNTYYKVYSLLDTLDVNVLRPWLFRVALNDYIDLKRKKAQLNVPLSPALEASLRSEDAIEQLLQRDEAMQLLNRIQPAYKEIFMLKYYYDLSYDDIGTLLQLTPENVKQKLYRARKTIRSEAKGLQKWIQQFSKR